MSVSRFGHVTASALTGARGRGGRLTFSNVRVMGAVYTGRIETCYDPLRLVNRHGPGHSHFMHEAM